MQPVARGFSGNATPIAKYVNPTGGDPISSAFPMNRGHTE
jgi:hypothetical protein